MNDQLRKRKRDEELEEMKAKLPTVDPADKTLKNHIHIKEFERRIAQVQAHGERKVIEIKSKLDEA